MFLGGVLALLITLVAWPLVAPLITAAHVGGQALTASASGMRVKSVRVRGRPGKAVITGPVRAAADLVRFAGHLAPPVFGVVGAVLLDDGQVRALLVLALFFLFLLLLQVDDLLSRFFVVAFGGMVAFVLAKASPGAQTLFAYTWTWFLLIGGFRHTFQQSFLGGDAVDLRESTYVPARLWMLLFWMFAFAALGFGGGILLGLIGQHAQR